MATTGWATVAEITPQGAMLLQYQDGKAAWKLINPDNPRQQTAVAAKNVLKPARFVETKKREHSHIPFWRHDQLL